MNYRVALGPGAPAALAEFLRDCGIEPVGFTQRHTAALYVDFVGARPSGIALVNVDIQSRAGGARPDADLVTDNEQTIALLVIGALLKFTPPLLTADAATLAAIRGLIGAAPNPVPIILSGEIGAGKYNLARLCHFASRTSAPLINVNCARFEEAIAEPRRDLESASAAPQISLRGSTLFLDELGELSEAAQLKLLAMLQESDRAGWPGGAQAPAPQLRIIGATNRALTSIVERGELRRELYWRLNVFTAELPPLRQRAGDVPMLANYLLKQKNPRRIFTPGALKLLSSYAFPGNVLELEGLITRLALAPLSVRQTEIDVADIRSHLTVNVEASGGQVSGWQASREEARRAMILRTIAAAGGDRAEAARRLRITPRALQYHITKAGLSRRRTPRTQPVMLPTSDPSPITPFLAE